MKAGQQRRGVLTEEWKQAICFALSQAYQLPQKTRQITAGGQTLGSVFIDIKPADSFNDQKQLYIFGLWINGS